MTVKKKRKRAPYYGRKGGSAIYPDEMKFDLSSTLKALRDYYEGKMTDKKRS